MPPTLTCISPVDGSVFAERATFDPAVAEAAVARAKAAQKAWAARPLAERAGLVLAGIEALGDMGDDVLVTELAWMMGRPVRYGGEFSGYRERGEYMASIAAEALAPVTIEDSPGFVRRIERVAHDLVLVVVPWNYPYMTAINTVAPALIAGSAVMLKMATQTLLAGERMEQAFVKAGVPAEIFQNVHLDHDTTTGLIAANHFGFVNFTGSVTAGARMEKAAAGTFTGVATELGGKDPGYVRADADLDAAAATLVDGAMFNSGQCCCGIERIYVHEHLYDAFVERAVEIVQDYRLGNPLDAETTIGPMANVRFADEVRAQIAEAVRDGAKAHIDTFAEDDGGAYLTPQVLTDVTHDMRIMKDESFGPVVGIMKVSSDEQAIELMNDSEFGLTCSIWTGEADKAAEIGRRVETGTVFMNRCDYLDPALCWTGCKNTGRGGGLSFIGFHNLTRPKSFHLKKATS